MKKRLVILVVALVIVSTSASAMAIGGAFSLDPIGGTYYGAAVSLKLDKFDPVLGISFRLGSSQSNIGLTADWWLYHAPLVGILNLYIGPGGYLSLSMGDYTSVDLGVRVPIGLQIFPIDPLELFLEIAPALGIQFRDPIGPSWGLQGAVGFRFWF